MKRIESISQWRRKELMDRSFFEILHTKEVKGNFTRAGFIPYIERNGEYLYLFGEDARFGELSAFAGTPENFENFLDTAIRELKEESLGIFKYETDEERKYILQETLCVCERTPGKEKIIIFLRVSILEPGSIVIRFAENKQLVTCTLSENKAIMWVSEDTLIDLCRTNIPTWSTDPITHEPRMYPRLYNVEFAMLTRSGLIDKLSQRHR